jgi:hypothetical protein
MMASANSMEVGVMGLQEDQISWEQWTQEDAARAELPLSVDRQETFPVGLGLDTSTQCELPWGQLKVLSLNTLLIGNSWVRILRLLSNLLIQYRSSSVRDKLNLG